MTFKTILITGTPGTGKTFLAKKLSLLLGYTYFDINSFIKKAHIYSSCDSKRQTYVVDTSKLAKELIKVRERCLKEGRQGIIFDSHLSHFLPSKYADLCVVTKCSLEALQQRLAKRGYSKAKIRENLDAEIFDTCLVEAVEQGHKVITFKGSVKAFSAKIKRLLAVQVRIQFGFSSDLVR